MFILGFLSSLKGGGLCQYFEEPAVNVKKWHLRTSDRCRLQAGSRNLRRSLQKKRFKVRGLNDEEGAATPSSQETRVRPRSDVRFAFYH